MKSIWLNLGVGSVLALSFAGALCAVLDWRPGDSDWEVERSVGTFASRDAAVSASLKRLSKVIRRHPTTQQFRIYFGHGGGGATLYDRKYKQIGFENDPGSGFIVCWLNVDDAAIHAAAATNGTFESFGKEAWPPSVTWRPKSN